MRGHWSVKDGILIYDGKGQSLQTVKDYGNFEFFVDWRIQKAGDSGIYLRGTPQVQIWDNPVGSGGLFNNQKNPSKPLVVADKPVGEWNTFWIRMVGDKVTVKLNDKREFKAKAIGADRRTDVALIKIEGTGLPVVRFGDPNRLKVGEWVVAIGSPFGFENSVTAGIVSATSRSLPEGTYVPFIQTDAAVNPGNSGGPLFNMKGEVIGINSQIYSRTGGYQGLAFAIPVDVAANVKTELVQHGKVERGRLGVSIQEVSQSLAQSFGLERPRGALVAQVEKGSPAEKAGMKPGDVLLGINGRTVERSAELPPPVAAVKPGTKATFELWRDGRKQTLDVTVGALNAEQVAAGRASEAGAEAGKLGLAVRPSESGLVVENATGAAARAGIRAGDVVTAVNGKPVKSVEELKAAAEKAKGSIALLVRRGDDSIFVPIEIG